MIKFSVSRLENEDILLEGTEKGGEFLDLMPEDAFSAASDVEYRLNGHYMNGSVLVAGEAHCTVASCCGRCLEPLQLELENRNINLFFEDVHEEELDVSADIREELLMLLPVNPLCDDSCKGLCPGCSANLNREKCRCKKTEEPENSPDSPWGELDKLNLS